MPNVDQFERQYKVLLQGIAEEDPNKITESTSNLYGLPQANKPTLFRNHNENMITDSAYELMNKFDHVSDFKYSVNNKDLYDVLINNKHHLEIKLGSATDAAIGLATVEELTSVNFSEPNIQEWRDRIQSCTQTDLENTDILESRLAAYRKFIRESAEKIELQQVSDKANQILNNFVLGLNVNSEEISALQNIPTITLTTYTKKGWVLKDLVLDKESEWSISEVDYNETTNRVKILFSNGEISIKILSNQKNSYKSVKLKANGIKKIEPLYGFGSLSFNLWVNRD